MFISVKNKTKKHQSLIYFVSLVWEMSLLMLASVGLRLHNVAPNRKQLSWEKKYIWKELENKHFIIEEIVQIFWSGVLWKGYD